MAPSENPTSYSLQKVRGWLLGCLGTIIKNEKYSIKNVELIKQKMNL